MNIAYTMAPGRGDTDLLLFRLAGCLIARGRRPAGVVQINTDRPDAGPCDMDVRVLPVGETIRISQSLGAGARGCRLDPDALEGAVGLVAAGLDGADCLIVNKFGRHEAEGRGFRPVIAEAVSRGIPVLVGLNALNRPAFLDFTAGLATALPPDLDHLDTWLSAAMSDGMAAA